MSVSESAGYSSVISSGEYPLCSYALATLITRIPVSLKSGSEYSLYVILFVDLSQFNLQ